MNATTDRVRPHHRGLAHLVTRGLAILFLGMAATLATAAEDDEIARLTEERQALNDILSGLNGKPQQLQDARAKLAESYRDLVSLETRLRGFQLWNAFVGVVGVANDTITKVNPGSSIVVATANFINDRAVDAYKKWDAGYLPAKVKKLSGSVVGIAPALRQLDQAMRMTPEQVADQLVARGMVENTWLQRWQNTPDKVAKSDSVVTGKITFIQERIGPAKAALVQARKDLDEVIPSLSAEIDSLKRKIAALDAKIKNAKNNQDFLENLEKARNVAAPPPTEKVQTYPGEAKQYGAAAGDYKSAWGDLKTGTINGHTYRLRGTKSSYDASAYFSQVMKPVSDAYRAASDYFWKEMPPRLRQIEDSKTRRQVYQAGLDRLIKASDAYWKVCYREMQAMDSQYRKPVKALQDEERQEYERRSAFFNRFKAFEAETVEYSWGDPWNLKIETRQTTLRGLGTAGHYLAMSAWGPINSLNYLWPATAPIGPLKGSVERYRQWREQATKIDDFAQSLYNTARSQSGRLSGYASQADSFASELEPNIAVWDGLYWGSPEALQTFTMLNQSGQLFSQYAALREQEAQALLKPHRENRERASRGESVMQRAEQLLEKAQALLEIKKTLFENYFDGGIGSFGPVGRNFLQWNKITEEEVERIKQLTESLKTTEAVEQHVIKLLSNHHYWEIDPTLPYHTRKSLAEVRKRYAERDGTAAQTFNDYQGNWSRYSRMQRELEQQIARISRDLDDIAPGQSIYLQEDELFNQMTGFESRWRESNYWYWSPPEPQDLPAGWPNAASLFDRMDAALQAYDAKLAGFMKEVENGFPKRAAEIDALAGRARSYRNASAIGPAQSALDEIWRKATAIYSPLSNAGILKPEMRITRSMQNFRMAHYEAMSRLSYLANRNSAVRQYNEWMDRIEALIRQAPTPDGRSQARQWQQDLEDSLRPNSFINYYVNQGEAVARSAVERGRNTLPKLIAYLGSFTISNEQIQTLYQNFIDAYGRGDIRGVLALLASDWQGGDGADTRDVEDMLINSFKVFDRIQYRISNFSAQPLGNDTVRVSYRVSIVGENSRQRLQHEESSQIVEEVGLVDGKPRILRTLSGSQWIR